MILFLHSSFKALLIDRDLSFLLLEEDDSSTIISNMMFMMMLNAQIFLFCTALYSCTSELL